MPPSKSEVEAAVKVIAAYDMRNADTIIKCVDLARKVLEAAEKVRTDENRDRK